MGWEGWVLDLLHLPFHRTHLLPLDVKDVSGGQSLEVAYFFLHTPNPGACQFDYDLFTFKDLLYLKCRVAGTHTHRDSDRYLPSIGSVPKWPRTYNSILVLYVGSRD